LPSLYSISIESHPVVTPFSRKSISIRFSQPATREQRWTQTINHNVAERQFYGLSHISGFSVHANVGIDARDRDRLERLCKYAGRPAIATERLTALPDGRLLYRLKRPWRDGTTAVIFDREDFIAKLAVLVPAPRAHLVRYHGILGPAAACRPIVVPTTAAAAANNENPSETGSSPVATPHLSTIRSHSDFDSAPTKPSVERQRNYTWSELMKRVFLLDVLRCEQCGGHMKVIAAIHAPDVARRILDCLGLPSRAPPLTRAVSAMSEVESF